MCTLSIHSDNQWIKLNIVIWNVIITKNNNIQTKISNHFFIDAHDERLIWPSNKLKWVRSTRRLFGVRWTPTLDLVRPNWPTNVHGPGQIWSYLGLVSLVGTVSEPLIDFLIIFQRFIVDIIMINITMNI